MTLIFILSVLGMAQAGYLLRKKLAKKRPVCIIGKECNKVLESKYGRLFVVPNEVLGLLFYISVILLAILQQKTLMELIIFAGALFSFFLFYLQWRIIMSWCFWCLTSSFTVWIMAILALLW